MSRTWRVEFVTPDGRFVVEAAEDEFLLAAAARAGLKLPHTCLQGRCTTCAAKLLRGRVDQSEAVRFYDEDREAGFILPCSARARSDLVIVTHEQEALLRSRTEHGLPAPRD